MRDPQRIDIIIKELERYWKANPQLRLGQIVGNCSRNIDPYLIEDDDLLIELRQQPYVG